LARALPKPRHIDPTDDGTTAGNLAAALSELELTPTRGGSGYPYIALVTYNKLPRNNRRVEDIGIPHWIVRLDADRYHDPYHEGQRGANLFAGKAVLDAAERGVSYRVGIVERPREVIEVSYKAREPYDRVVHVVPQECTAAQFDTVQAVAFGVRQGIVFSVDDACLPIEGLRSRKLIFWGVPAANQQSYRDFVAAWYPAPEIPTVIEFREFSGPPSTRPTIQFSGQPLTIVAGQSSQLDWVVMNANSVKLGGEVVTAQGSRTVKPASTTIYALTATGAGGTAQSNVMITVTPAPPPPPPPSKVGVIGVHCIGDVTAGRYAASVGCPMVTVMSNYVVARELADRGVMVLYREYIDHPHEGAQLAQRVMEAAGGRLHPGIIHLGFNECDNGLCYGTPEQIRIRAYHDSDFMKVILANGGRVGIGGFSMGCPDYTSDTACAAMREHYAPLWNNDDSANPRVFLNYHSYSHNADQLLSLSGTRALSAQSAEPNTADMERALILVGRDQHEAVVMRPKRIEERAITTYDPIWLELRWLLLFTKCGFRPDKRGIIGDETGEDEGGIGGFKAHNRNADTVARWCSTMRAVSSRDIVVNGKPYPSPWLGATLFMYGNDGKWSGGYDCRPFTDAIKAAVWP
jgi:hypothetical protein